VIRYLVDTNVLSYAAPGRAGHAPRLVTWMVDHSDRLYLSVVTIAEIEQGIAKSRRQGASRQAGRLSEWVEASIVLYADRILPINLDVARVAGRLSDDARGKGHAPGFADAAIAATARVHDLMVLTRNLRHFGPLAAEAWDPFDMLPPDRQGPPSPD
jgi:predicted nucleic acid-binding protein